MKGKITIYLVCSLLIVGCASEKVTEKSVDIKAQTVEKKESDDTPNFVKEAHFKQIHWEKEVKKIGTNGVSDIIGNPQKTGYIGPELQAEKTDKWLWHFYGKPNGSLTVIGYHQETAMISPILISGYTINFGSGAMNGAEATMPSNVSLPKPGKWALLVYIDEELYDTLVINVKEKA